MNTGFSFLSALLVLCGSAGMQGLYAQAPAQADSVPGCSTPLRFSWLPAGSFSMGSAAGAPMAAANEQPQRQVKLSGFYMSQYEITWEQYNAFVQDEAFSRNADADAITRPSPPYLDFTLGMGKEGFPASSMQQYGALMFCKWLYQRTGVFYRLPTEAEWEYACRAGSTAAWSVANDSAALTGTAWYYANSQQKYQPVGQKAPNAWGLYDMMGNVAEWVLDQYDSSYLQTVGEGAKDPLITPTRRNPRLVRGGSYRDAPEQLRCACRTPANPVWNRRDPQIPKSKWWNTDAPFVGFRLVKPWPQPDTAQVEVFFNTYLIK
ncbi:MAG: formylglycine-generating enzyme family protein [Chitinophagaceae bacterium]|nr:formylglycine-generating enzyme family protein [Chitinophagaceae bacterium]